MGIWAAGTLSRSNATLMFLIGMMYLLSIICWLTDMTPVVTWWHLPFHVAVSWVLGWLIRCVPSEEISTLGVDLEVTWTGARQTLICLILGHNVSTVGVELIMLSVTVVFSNLLLLLIWYLLQKRKVISFAILFLDFGRIHIWCYEN
jgi:hypothetical protein